MQNLEFPTVEFNEILLCPSLNLGWAWWITSKQWISHFSQFFIVWKLSEHTLCLIIYLINEDIKQYFLHPRPLSCFTSDLPITGLFVIDHHPLGQATQSIFNHMLSNPCLVLSKDAMGNIVKEFTKVQVKKHLLPSLCLLSQPPHWRRLSGWLSIVSHS